MPRIIQTEKLKAQNLIYIHIIFTIKQRLRLFEFAF